MPIKMLEKLKFSAFQDNEIFCIYLPFFLVQTPYLWLQTALMHTVQYYAASSLFIAEEHNILFMLNVVDRHAWPASPFHKERQIFVTFNE